MMRSSKLHDYMYVHVLSYVLRCKGGKPQFELNIRDNQAEYDKLVLRMHTPGIRSLQSRVFTSKTASRTKVAV